MLQQIKKDCKELVKEEWEDRKKDLQTLLDADDNTTEELGSLNEYGLCIDKVEAGTFEHQREDYIRYQFSWGGPSDELRIYKNGELEYWHMDWFDGASLDVSEDKTAQAIAEYILEIISF